MNGDDELLFTTSDIEDWKASGRPSEWLEHLMAITLARHRAQITAIADLLDNADDATRARLEEPL